MVIDTHLSGLNVRSDYSVQVVDILLQGLLVCRLGYKFSEDFGVIGKEEGWCCCGI